MSDSLSASGESISPKQSAFGQTYWMLNSIEMFERLAYFGIRAVVPLYIMQATEPGGLHLTALHKGWIAAAGVDVVTQEPPLASNPLLQYSSPRLIVTPHGAWASRAARQRLVTEIVDNIGAFLHGSPRNTVC